MEIDVILIIVGLVAAIIITVIVIKSIIENKKKEEEVMPKLDAWIKNALEQGYNYTRMATLLEINGWDKRLVEKGLKENGIVKPEFYF